MTRKDAIENRERVLDAAIAVVGEHGVAASTERIAERAGVGVGTVFRHFPTKEALLTAVFERLLARLGDHARARASERDAGAAFFSTLEFAIEQSGTKKAIADALAGGGMDVRRRVWAGDLRGALTTLLERAQTAGAVRDDIGLDEVMAVLAAASRALEVVGPGAVRTRTLAVLLDGLRARGPVAPKPTRSRRAAAPRK